MANPQIPRYVEYFLGAQDSPFDFRPRYGPSDVLDPHQGNLPGGLHNTLKLIYLAQPLLYPRELPLWLETLTERLSERGSGASLDEF